MKRICVFFACVFFLGFFSCGKKVSIENVAGRWESVRTIRTELLSYPDDKDSVFGYFFMDQTVVYDFGLEGRFTKRLVQKFKKCEFLENCPLDDDARGNLEKSIAASDSDYMVSGGYTLSSKKIHFEPETYSFAGETKPFSAAEKNAPFLLSHFGDSKYELHGESLMLSDELGNFVEFNLTKKIEPNDGPRDLEDAVDSKSSGLVKKSGPDIVSRFDVPDGFVRNQYDEGSFAEYLRHFPLKDFGSPVLLYDGRKKNGSVHVSVFDMPILNQDLIQCADAVIKIRAEYLYSSRLYDQIQFHLTNGLLVPFSKYADGLRVVASGNDVEWKDGYKRGYEREVFDSYLKTVYTYAGTLSLSHESKRADLADIEPGNFFIQGGTPGHVVLVLDVAEESSTGKKIMLLGQSYMPSQDFHILKSFEKISPWYYVDDAELVTPEWRFPKNSLMKF